MQKRLGGESPRASGEPLGRVVQLGVASRDSSNLLQHSVVNLLDLYGHPMRLTLVSQSPGKDLPPSEAIALQSLFCAYRSHVVRGVTGSAQKNPASKEANPWSGVLNINLVSCRTSILRPISADLFVNTRTVPIPFRGVSPHAQIKEISLERR